MILDYARQLFNGEATHLLAYLPIVLLVALQVFTALIRAAAGRVIAGHFGRSADFNAAATERMKQALTDSPITKGSDKQRSAP